MIVATFQTDNFTAETEDNGAAMIGEIEGFSHRMFVRIQSWDRLRGHDEMKSLIGKRVRVVVEVMED